MLVFTISETSAAAALEHDQNKSRLMKQQRQPSYERPGTLERWAIWGNLLRCIRKKLAELPMSASQIHPLQIHPPQTWGRSATSYDIRNS